MMSGTPEHETLEARCGTLTAQLAAERARSAELVAERDRLKKAYRDLQLELELLKRRLFVAKAERVDTKQLELEFAAKLAELDALAGITPDPDSAAKKPEPDSAEPDPADNKKKRPKPTGRRNLRALDLPEERIELVDPDLEGKAQRIGFEESVKIAWRRGGPVRVIAARVKYLVDGPTGASIETAPMPPQTFTRTMAAPSLLAHVISDKFCDGLPLYRQEDRFARLGIDIDRGLMSKWLEDAGATLGASIVPAMWHDAIQTAFCLATDATGVAVQPTASPDNKKRQPCRRAHFFGVLADRDHVFFRYEERETSKVVAEIFRGYSGYVQADAKSVFDVLFVPPAERPPPDDDDTPPDDAERSEVGCWSHARRKFWEAATAKIVVAREALVRIKRIFDLEAQWKGKPPIEIKQLRTAHTRPHLDALFAWAELEYAKVKGERGMLRSAFGYLVRQREALTRFVEDGRLKPDNNRTERELRRVAVGRKAWLFVGSDDHGEAAGHLLTLVASARLHGLDPERYLRDILRVLAHWPRERYLELAPKYWNATKARLDQAQLDMELGPLTIPPLATPEEQPSAK